MSGHMFGCFILGAGEGGASGIHWCRREMLLNILPGTGQSPATKKQSHAGHVYTALCFAISSLSDTDSSF